MSFCQSVDTDGDYKAPTNGKICMTFKHPTELTIDHFDQDEILLINLIKVAAPNRWAILHKRVYPLLETLKGV